MKTHKCKQCQVDFLTKISRQKFCSDKCRYKYHQSKNNKRSTSISQSQKVNRQDLSINLPVSLDLSTKLLTTLNRIKDLLEKQSNLQEEYLVPKQVCRLLSFNRSTFDRYVELGLFKLYRLGKGKVYVKRTEIDQLFQN